MLASFLTIEMLASFIPKYNTCQCVAVGVSLPEHHYPQALCQGVALHGHSSWAGWPVPPLSLHATAGEWTSPMGDPPTPAYSPGPWRVCQCPISDDSRALSSYFNSCADSRHWNMGQLWKSPLTSSPRPQTPGSASWYGLDCLPCSHRARKVWSVSPSPQKKEVQF